MIYSTRLNGREARLARRYGMKASDVTRFLAPFFVSFMLSSVVAAETTVGSSIAQRLCDIKTLIVQVIPTIALIMFLLAGLAYAAGQAFGAETKAKAQGWAMSLLVGGIVGIIIAVLAPTLVDIFVGMNSVGMSTNPCGASPAV